MHNGPPSTSRMCDEGRRLLGQRRAGMYLDPSIEPTEHDLLQLAETEGIDTETAVIYERLRISVQQQSFIESVDNGDPPRIVDEMPRVVIVPGAFHEEYPHTGADGARMVKLANSLGWPAERVPLPSLAPMARNAAAIADFLMTRAPGPIILVSLSKGGADVRAAFARPDAATALRTVRGWLNLSGILTGTPLVGWLRARPLRCCGVRLLLRLRQQRFAVLDELRRGVGSPLDGPVRIPKRVNVIHVYGFPLVSNLSDAWARRGHARLAPLGANDGGGILLADVARLPGDIYPVWGADHYLRPSWDISPLLTRLLQEAAAPSHVQTSTAIATTEPARISTA